MLTTEIHEAAVEFACALGQAPAVDTFRAAATALESDPAALLLLAELRESQASFLRAQRTGTTPGPDEIDALRRCQARVRANETIMAHLHATSEVNAFLPTVAAEVTKSLGADFAALVALAC